ncbi:hypothetical protein MRB53_041362 [Persea americana]|nr:hypothetical protein MRB53_041362 [Persea americana]
MEVEDAVEESWPRSSESNSGIKALSSCSIEPSCSEAAHLYGLDLYCTIQLVAKSTTFSQENILRRGHAKSMPDMLDGPWYHEMHSRT